MIKTWSSDKGEETACEKCGSIYEVKTYRLPARDHDSFTCQVCGSLMHQWNDTHVPSFKLKSAGKKPNKLD